MPLQFDMYTILEYNIHCRKLLYKIKHYQQIIIFSNPDNGKTLFLASHQCLHQNMICNLADQHMHDLCEDSIELT